MKRVLHSLGSGTPITPKVRSEPDITCIINCHRESYLINSTLASVERAAIHAEHCGLKVNIIIVQDNADEDTKNILERYIKEKWQVIDLQNGDLASSRNDAISVAEGKYSAFIDGDDLCCQSWLLDAYIAAESRENNFIWHPEYNLYFGDRQHVFKHVDMEDYKFQKEYIYSDNYWTALSFALTSVYRDFPFRENTITDGFGYEDWTWNYETMKSGLIHKVVQGTAHYIRRGKSYESLLDRTNEFRAIPRILPLYSDSSTCLEDAK